MEANNDIKASNFLEEIILEDLKSGKHKQIITRFPPEPNGFMHIGHAKAICISFGLAEKYNGLCNLRFDDTNPVAEDPRFVEAMKTDIQWLGFKWDQELNASDYFQQIYDWAEQLILAGKAYVDFSTQEEMHDQRGVPSRPGTHSPYRDTSPAENLDLLRRMQAGEFEEGKCTLRAKIDMSSPNMQLRDPVMYRILRKPHHKTGTRWNIYPTYDYAHGQCDSIENITHSLCSLEFEVHRPLYDWFIEQLGIYPSRQYEFSRLNINYLVMSKRKLKRLVLEGFVKDWDDPRMPTISGMRRRGYTPGSIRNMVERVGVTRQESIIDFSLLEYCVREDLNKICPRVMAVLEPIKVTLTNWPDGLVEQMEVENNPEDPASGNRLMPFGKTLYIEQDDFLENPPKGFFRLGPGLEVRLKAAYIIRCDEVILDAEDKVTELLCSYDPSSRSGNDTSGKKVKGTIHWVSAAHAIDVEARLYDRLFTHEDPEAEAEAQGVDFVQLINPDSLVVLPQVKAEPSLANLKAGDRVQFMRKAYFVVDPDSTPEHLIFNRTVALKDAYAKAAGK
jgi:glutaminyl-tRNA synthetase